MTALFFRTTLLRTWISPVASRFRSTTTSGSEPQILMERLGGNRNIVQITLNRPKANAMGSVMIQELQDSLNSLEQETDSRCVVLTSFSQKVFSAGADLKERKSMTQGEAEEFVTLLRNTMERVAKLEVPVIAAIEGVALGGGLELALAADLRVASSNATFGLPETTLAIVPGAGGTQRLPRLVGVSRAKDLIWTGRRIQGEEAFQYGLVDKVVQPGEATSVAIHLAQQISANGPVAIRASKEAIDRGSTFTNMKDALEIERQCYAKVLPTEDRLEGLTAFAEGRTPEYKGQ